MNGFFLVDGYFQRTVIINFSEQHLSSVQIQMAERISSESLDWFVYELEKEEEQEVEFLEALDKIMEEANSFVEGPD